MKPPFPTQARLGSVCAAPEWCGTDYARRRRRRFADKKRDADGCRKYGAALRVLDWDLRRRSEGPESPRPPPAIARRAVAALFSRDEAPAPPTAEDAEVLARLCVFRRGILAQIGTYRDAPTLDAPDLAADALARLFSAAVDDEDAHSSAQVIALAATFHADAGGDTRSDDDKKEPTFVVETSTFRDVATDAIARCGHDKFWDDALLESVGTELALMPAEHKKSWDEHLGPDALLDAVSHVHTVVFNRLVAVVTNMRLLGEPDDAVAKFASRTAVSAQLPKADRAALADLLDAQRRP